MDAVKCHTTTTNPRTTTNLASLNGLMPTTSTNLTSLDESTFLCFMQFFCVSGCSLDAYLLDVSRLVQLWHRNRRGIPTLGLGQYRLFFRSIFSFCLSPPVALQTWQESYSSPSQPHDSIRTRPVHPADRQRRACRRMRRSEATSSARPAPAPPCWRAPFDCTRTCTAITRRTSSPASRCSHPW